MVWLLGLALQGRELWPGQPAFQRAGKGRGSAQEGKARFGISGLSQELGAGGAAWLWVRRGRALPPIARHLDHRPWWVAVQTHV